MPKVLANGLNFHYLQVGMGPDLVMLHGLMGNLAVWHLRTVPLLRNTFRVTTYDLRGHGRSDMPPSGYTTGDMAEDLADVLAALGIVRPCLVGHSLGADIALHFALRYPDQVSMLVLIEPGIPALVHMRKDQAWEGWAYWAATIEEYTGVSVPPSRWTDLDYMVRMSLDTPIIYGPARGRARQKAPILNLLDRTTIVQDYECVDVLTLANIATIAHPKLLIYDSGSPYLSSYHILLHALANCTPVLLPAGRHRHFSPLEQPEQLLKHMLAFLQPEAVRL